jgi:hypothetical protein
VRNDRWPCVLIPGQARVAEFIQRQQVAPHLRIAAPHPQAGLYPQVAAPCLEPAIPPPPVAAPHPQV